MWNRALIAAEDVYNNGYLNHPLARSLDSLVEEVCKPYFNLPQLVHKFI
jgi:hypothetical protein